MTSVNTDYIEIVNEPASISTGKEFIPVECDKLLTYILDRVGKSIRDGNEEHSVQILNDYQIAKIIFDPGYKNKSDKDDETARGFFVDIQE